MNATTSMAKPLAFPGSLNPFVAQTYRILLLTLAAIAVLGLISFYTLPRSSMLALGIADCVIWILCGWLGWRHPLRLLLPLFAIMTGLFLGQLAHWYASVFLMTTVMTLGAFAGLAVYTHVTKRDFSFLRGFLWAAFFILLSSILVVPLVHSRWVSLGYAAFGTITFLCWILFDTSQIVHWADAELTPGIAAFELLLDIIGLHRWLLIESMHCYLAFLNSCFVPRLDVYLRLGMIGVLLNTVLRVQGAEQRFTTGTKVSVWGQNSFGQADAPADLNNAVGIASGEKHCLALRADGTVIAWGDNSYGQTDMPIGLNGAVAVAAGFRHSVGLKDDGTVVAWGDRSDGQTNLPVSLSNVVAVASGAFHNLALRADGKVLGWGSNSTGQATVPDELSNVVAVACGYYHSLALRVDRTVVAWGVNTFGQSSVPPNLTNVVAVSAGKEHSLALKADGSVVAWGDGRSGQTTLPSGLGFAIAPAAGAFCSMAILANRTLAAWGNNDYGQNTLPIQLTQVVSVAGGGNHTLVLGQTTIPSIPVRSFGFTQAANRISAAGATLNGMMMVLPNERVELRLPERDVSNVGDEGESPSGSANFNGHVVKPEQQRVQTQNLAALGVQVPRCLPISRRLASAGTADPGDLKSPSLPGASPGSPSGVPTRGHHVVPRCKGGWETVPTCRSCEDFIHKTWSHKELRDTFNTVEKIQADPRFQKFLRWLYKQQPSASFRTRRNRSRTSQPYR